MLSISAPQPVASSSRRCDHPPSTTPPAQCRPPRRRLARSAVAFALTLCIPYVVSASPLPESAGTSVFRQHRHNSTSRPPTSSSGVMYTLQAASRAAVHHLVGRRAPTPGLHPTITLATHEGSGLYRIPDDYVVLKPQFNGGFIVLSFAIAFVGSLCTLELLTRRTSNSGWRNQVLLGSAGVTFGAVSTFAMHFVFNNSLSLHHPYHAKHYPAIYLSYDPGITVLSLVVSCLAMIMAFFVMGTHLSDWYCMPGRRERKGSNSSHATSQHDEDEYGNWKSSHAKMLRTGTVGMVALLQRAGAVAKWSSMDPVEEGEKRGWKTALKDISSKDEKADEREFEGPFGDDEEAIIKHDKKLAELDFRLGRSAVKLELEHRQDKTQTSPVTSFSHVGSSVRLIPSNSSLPQTPLPILHPPFSRRRSLPLNEMPDAAASAEVPGHDFHFASRADTEQSPPIDTESASANHSLAWRPGYPQMSDFSTTPPTDPQRRGSLPDASFNRPASNGIRSGLMRIQSMSEVEQKAASMARIPSDEEKFDRTMTSPTLSVTAQLNTLEATRDPSVPEKRVRIVGKRTLSKLEKFLGFDVVTTAEIIKIFITGTIAGFGVVGMHYIGQFSITGLPYIAYKAPYVVGSIVIASGAVIIALYIMFIMLRPKLKHTWLSKVMVATILAVAVCAMHFCGMMGTIYAWPKGQGITGHNMLQGTNRAITAIVTALAFLACLACGVFFLLHSARLKKERARRRRVVVAAVFLDSNDRVLVDATDGLLPMCDIASLSGSGEVPGSKRSIKSGFGSISSDSTVLGMDLTTGHDAFVSALRMSWSWKNPNVALPHSAVPGSDAAQQGQQTLAGTIADIRRGSLMTVDSAAPSARQTPVSVSKFVERFAISASQLASRLVGQRDGIARLGVLYDQILTTGWVKLHHSTDTVSKGQMIFLVRRVTSPVERMDLLSRHYIFADPEAVASALHKTLSAPLDHTMPLLQDIRLFCDSTMRMSLKPATLYAGVAVVQATPFDGLRLLLEQGNRSQLPMQEICPISKISNEHDDLTGTLEELGEAITWLDGMTLLSVISRNMTVDPEQLGGPRVTRLLLALERAIVPMLDDMLTAEDMMHILPRLFLHPVLVPLTPGGSLKATQLSGYVPPHIVVFYAHYDAAVNTFTDKWLPFSLFRAQNACVMAQKIRSTSRAEDIIATNTTTDPQAEEVNVQRRPSKVQFDFPPQLGEKETPPFAQNNDVVSPAIFNRFSFPARSHETCPLETTRNPSVRGNGPRRSSLARSQFNSTSAEGPHPLDTPNVKQAIPRSASDICPGVASWDPEWLLVLLRTKLRADA